MADPARLREVANEIKERRLIEWPCRDEDAALVREAAAEIERCRREHGDAVAR